MRKFRIIEQVKLVYIWVTTGLNDVFCVKLAKQPSL